MFSLHRINLLLLVAMPLTSVSCGDAPEENPRVHESSDSGLGIVNETNLRVHPEWLADDARQGREAGTPGHEAAAKYVAAFFAKLGLEPAGDEGWYQQVPLITYQIDNDAPLLTVHRDGVDSTLVYRDDYVIRGDKVRPETSVRGEAVYVGFGVHAPELGYSDYEDVDVVGKIVVLFGGAPSTFEHYERAYYASSRSKAEEAARRGAIGVIALRSRYAQRSYTWERISSRAGKTKSMAWVSLSGEASDYIEQLRGIALLSSKTASELFIGSPITFEEMLDAIDDDVMSSIPLGFEISIAGRTIHDRITSPNVIGLVRGSDPALADEYVAYSAHLDGVGIDPAPDGEDNIRNGAYDNAMGISIMLETARVFAADPPARSILFIALTAEEKGLLGSDYFAHYPTVPTGSIVANINVDMPLFLYPVADLNAFGSEHSSLEATVAAAAEAEGFVLTPNPLPEENLFVRSDQYSFVRQGIPSTYLKPGLQSTDPDIDAEAMFQEHRLNHYHTVSDDLNRPVDWDSVERFTRAHIRIGQAIADNPERPTWNDGDFFAIRFAR